MPPAETTDDGHAPATAGRRDLSALLGPLPDRVSIALTARPAVTALAATGVVLIAFFVLSTPGFETNDDVVLMMIANGSAYGAPSPDLVFMHPSIGLLLASLTSLISAVNWYSALLYGLHALVFAGSVYLVVQSRSRLWSRLALLAGAHLVFTLWMWQHLQFTHVAIMVSGIGVMLFGSLDNVPRWGIVAVGAFTGIGALIRWEGFVAVMVVAAPLLVAGLGRRHRLRTVAFAVGALAVVGLAVGFQAARYAPQPDWQEFLEYNTVRGRLHASGRVPQAIETGVARDLAGWSDTDARMFDSFFFTDPDVYSLDRLAAIDSATTAPNTAGDSLRALWNERLPRSRLLVIGLALVTAVVIAGRQGRIAAIALSAWVGLVLAALARFARLPARVAVPLLALLAIALITRPARFFGGPPDPDPVVRGPWRAVGSIAAVVGLVLVASAGLQAGFDRSRSARDAAASYQAMLDDFEKIGTDATWVNWAKVMLRRRASPETSGLQESDLQIITLGWPTHSPPHRAALAEAGAVDLYTAIATDESVLLPIEVDIPRASLFERYYFEHHGFLGQLRPVAWADDERLIVHDLLVTFERTDEGLIETFADGRSMLHPWSDQDAGLLEVGRTGDVVTIQIALLDPDSVDLLVVFDDTRKSLVDLVLPSPRGTSRAIVPGTVDTPSVVALVDRTAILLEEQP